MDEVIAQICEDKLGVKIDTKSDIDPLHRLASTRTRREPSRLTTRSSTSVTHKNVRHHKASSLNLQNIIVETRSIVPGYALPANIKSACSQNVFKNLFSNCSVIKYADDTAICGNLKHGPENYFQEVQSL